MKATCKKIAVSGREILFSLLCLCLLASCASVSKRAAPPADHEQAAPSAVRLAPGVSEDMLTASYWISRARNPYELRMTRAQIAAWNREVCHRPLPGNDRSYLITDLRKIGPVQSVREIRGYMFVHSPQMTWYSRNEDGSIHELDEGDWKKIYDEMNYAPLGSFSFFYTREGDDVEDRDFPVRKAVCVRRTDMRLLPSDTFYTDDSGYWYDDMAQNSGILMNEPVLVLWESAGGDWYYVRSSFCTGWVKKADIAFCSDAAFLRYFDYSEKDSGSFLTVTCDRFLLDAGYLLPPGGAAAGAGQEASGAGQAEAGAPGSIPELFMGTYLHTAGWADERFATAFGERVPYASYLAEIPWRKEDGSLGISYAAIPAGICRRGLVPFTTANLLTLAFKPLGVRYGWGGMASARDCSEYLKDLFHCFGFIFPRNSRDQLAMPGLTVDFGNADEKKRAKQISALESGAVMGFPGHVMLYLGTVEGKNYVISALGGYFLDQPDVSELIHANSVSVNTLGVYRRNGNTWLKQLTQAKLLQDDGSFKDRKIALDPKWTFASASKINGGKAMLYEAKSRRRNITVAVNAGHGTAGGSAVKTYSHPDKSPKLTGGTNPAGTVQSVAVSDGMTFTDGTPEAAVTLRTARLLRTELLQRGFDVLMIRDGEDVQLDNIARTVISNNATDIHIAIHFDLDSGTEDKGVFYCSIPEELRSLKNVDRHADGSRRLGECLVEGLRAQELPVYRDGTMEVDLTQTAYSTIPTVDIELGNQCSDHSTASLQKRVQGLADGIEAFFAGK